MSNGRFETSSLCFPLGETDIYKTYELHIPLTPSRRNIDEIISACNYAVADTDRLLPTNVHANNAFVP